MRFFLNHVFLWKSGKTPIKSINVLLFIDPPKTKRTLRLDYFSDQKKQQLNQIESLFLANIVFIAQ